MVGGAEEMVLNLVRRLPPRFEPVVCCIHETGPIGEEIRAAGTHVDVLGLEPGVRRPFDLARMRAYGVSLQQVFTALGRGNANAGGNYIEQGEQQYLIRGIGLLRSATDIGAIVVAEHNGTPLQIRDFAGVTVGSVPRQGIVGRDDAIVHRAPSWPQIIAHSRHLDPSSSHNLHRFRLLP